MHIKMKQNFFCHSNVKHPIVYMYSSAKCLAQLDLQK